MIMKSMKWEFDEKVEDKISEAENQPKTNKNGVSPKKQLHRLICIER